MVKVFQILLCLFFYLFCSMGWGGESNECSIGDASIKLPDDYCNHKFTSIGAEYSKDLNLVFCKKHREITVDNGGDQKSDFYNGLWYTKKIPDSSKYNANNSYFKIDSGGVLATISRNGKEGSIPLLSGESGFYIEIAVSLSNQNPNNWPALWLLPIEHNSTMSDHYLDDPDGFERWMELDIDEGGFSKGTHGTVHSWSGIWPKFNSIKTFSKSSDCDLNREKINYFGASYEPESNSVSWWLNGRKLMTASDPSVPTVAKKQNFYLIISAQNHNQIAGNDYSIFLHGFKAYSRKP